MAMRSFQTELLLIATLWTGPAALQGAVVRESASSEERGAADPARTDLRRELDELGSRPITDEVLGALENLHARAFEAGDVDTAHAAIDLWTKAWEERTPAESRELADEFNELGKRILLTGDYDAASLLFERALAIREEVLGPDDPDVLTSRNNVAGMLQITGQEEVALAMHERILATREALLGPDHLDVAQTLHNLGTLHGQLGHYERARGFLMRALAIYEEHLPPEHPDHVRTLRQLALVAENLGELAEARALHERVLALREAGLGPDHPDVAQTLNAIAILAQDLGDHAPARPLLERALAIEEAAFGPDHLSVARTLNNLGTVVESLGDEEGAFQFHTRALAIREKLLGPDHPEVARSRLNLGLLFYKRGQYEQARVELERTLAIQEAVEPPDPLQLAKTLVDLAITISELGEVEAAVPMLRRAAALQESSPGPGRPEFTTTLAALASVLDELGDTSEVRELCERVLAIRVAALGEAHPSVALARVELAQCALDEGQLQEAWEIAQRLSLTRGAVDRTVASMTEGESFLYLADLSGQLDLFLTVAAAVDDPGAAYDAVLEAKGRVGRLALRRHALAGEGIDEETARLAQRLANLQARLSSLALSARVDDVEERDARMDALRDERDGLERELRRRADLSSGTPVRSSDLAAALPPGSAVVDFLKHRVYVPAGIGEDGRRTAGYRSPMRLSAWILRAGASAPIHVDLGPNEAVQVAARAFVSELIGGRSEAAPGRGVRVAGDRPASNADAALRALVWDPLVPHLAGIDTVFVSPDGVLGTVPLETLRDGKGRFLVETRRFVYSVDVRSLAESAGAGEEARGAASGEAVREPASLLCVGGVDYGRAAKAPPSERVARAPLPVEDASGDALRGGLPAEWPWLPATRAESRAVVDLHARAFAGRGRRLLLQGAEASEERLDLELPRYSVLHLATHGFFQPDGVPSMWEEAQDALVGGSRRPRMTDSAWRLTGLHPGLLSGLVLAGASRPPDPKDGREDGYLTASEVSWLDLSGVDLVVLSACETGLGRPQSGEGLLGLRRAFHTAGAKTVISSLWSVEDESTAELMLDFYRNLWLEGMGREEALRAAQLAMLRRNRMADGEASPSTWGAFVLSGEWR